MLRKRPKDDGSWPTEIKFNKDSASVKVSFDDGFSGEIPYELLRIESPSAETRGHGGENPPPPTGKRNISVLSADPVGRYAIRINFSDGHNSGLYSWPYLRSLAQDQKPRMKAYIKRMKELELSRD